MTHKVLNVGGGGSRNLPTIFKGWDQVLLDIDSDVRPDIVCDAKKLRGLPPGQYDAVYSSHSLEHFYKHELPTVLGGFLHVLRPSGFAHITVPDMDCLFEQVRGKDIDDIWYKAGINSISFHDVIFGWGKMVAGGNAYYSHKTGFTQKSLGKAMRSAGFVSVMIAPDGIGNLFAFGFKHKPSNDKLRRLGI
jgi:predicted SAM-dependent methyltransferase